MERILLILAVFGGLSYATVSSASEIRQFLDGHFNSLAKLTKARM
jgi:hypothetical protein